MNDDERKDPRAHAPLLLPIEDDDVARSDEENCAAIRAAGGDPEAIGRRGAALVEAALARARGVALAANATTSAAPTGVRRTEAPLLAGARMPAPRHRRKHARTRSGKAPASMRKGALLRLPLDQSDPARESTPPGDDEM